MKPTIAIFSLTGCEGCSLTILELEDQLLDLLEAVEIVNFREGMSERSWNIDIGFIDGAVSTPEDKIQARHFRQHCRTLVAIGACACLGGINTLKNHQEEDDYRRRVYGDHFKWFATSAAQPISEVVKVDYELPGCPINKDEFLRFVRSVLNGRRFRLPDYPVCVECKKRGTICLYDRGLTCLGPLIRAGCGAICPAFGSTCEGCRGLLNDDVLKAAAINLPNEHGMAPRELLTRLRLFGAYQESKLP